MAVHLKCNLARWLLFVSHTLVYVECILFYYGHIKAGVPEASRCVLMRFG